MFYDEFGLPAKGNDKGKVEGLVGYSRRHLRIDRDRRKMERRIQLIQFPVTKESGYLRLHGDAEPEQILGAEVGTL